ncbi:hypothetical protein IE53DRAFT_365703 [Violaceomyces palustris]|uniref:Uncharacterized protein n=1 Tax=Violaceomyces palustris TaxID=1673888 RepID=A0ACD0P885_9BASI|nr:hypothetical protein IE53DRAFT_365703 [Violaceomyces palustris]
MILPSSVILSLLLATIGTSAFNLVFPAASTDYWVACSDNTLKWTSDANDPSIFSVALLNPDKKVLNGNFQIANSLKTSAGQATIHIPCIKPEDNTYSILFVNASHYSYMKGDVYLTSNTFSIKHKDASPSSGSSKDQTNSSSSLPSSSSQSNTATVESPSKTNPTSGGTSATLSYVPPISTANLTPIVLKSSASRLSNFMVTHIDIGTAVLVTILAHFLLV